MVVDGRPRHDRAAALSCCTAGCHAVGHSGESACALRQCFTVRICKAVIILRSISLAAGVLVLAVSACGFPQEFPAPPRNAPVVLPVKISPDGRIITVRAAEPCGHRPLLIARSYPHRVTLRLVNRDISSCHVEAVGVISVSVTLPHPLGTRQLVQALTGKPIKYHIGHF
jgi:hypothetical protein